MQVIFYRATKNLRGKGYAGDQLKDPEVHARHLQDAARYAKCLGVGMRPMLVLDRLKKGNSHAQQRYIAATTPKAAAEARARCTAATSL